MPWERSTVAYIGTSRSPCLVIVGGFWFFNYFWAIGFNAYEPELLSQMGHSLPAGLLFTGVGLLGNPVGALFSRTVIGRLGNRVIITMGISAAIVGLVLIATSTGSWMIMLGGFLTNFGTIACAGPGQTYTAELFPTRARASATGLADAIGHVGGAIAPYLIVVVLTTSGARVTFVLLLVTAVLALLILAAGQRTGGRPLSEISR